MHEPVRSNGEEGPVTSGDLFRLFVGAASGTAGALLLVTDASEVPLGISLLALGIFVVFHFIVEEWFMRVRDDSYIAPEDGGLREFASMFIATAGVVLGLLTIFGDKVDNVTTTVRVGTGALAVSILLGIILLGLLLVGAQPGRPAADQQPEIASDQAGLNFIRIVFNLVLWAFGLGLLCIATALLYR